MNEGFKPILDSMENTFGAIDEPSMNGEINFTIEGEAPRSADAVGWDDDGGVYHFFEWVEPDEQYLKQVAEEEGVPFEEVEEEIDLDDPILVQTYIVSKDSFQHLYANYSQMIRGSP